MCPIAPADQKNVFNCPILYSAYHLIGIGEYRTMGKTGCQHMTAINPAHAAIMLVSAQSQSLLNDRSKVFICLIIALNVNHSLISNN